MTQSNNDIEELEELLTELEGQEARLVAPYSDDDDAVTQLMDAPLGDQEWMVQVTALDRRMMSTDQVVSELRAGKLSNRTLVWRGGMDDWLPIARVESLSQAGPGSSPAAGSSRLAAPAPLPAPPLWSTLPSAAPLPPPPAAAPASSPAATASLGLAPTGMSSSPLVGLPPPPAAPTPPSETHLKRPVAASLPPAPMSSTSSNTARPVAIDFSDMAPETTGPLRGKRALIALGAVGILAVFLSAYALMSKSDGTIAAAPSAEQPRAVSALQPAGEKTSEPAAAKPIEPAAAMAAKPAESESAASDSTASSGSSVRTTAPARYSLRSEYRRRSRGSSGSDRAAEEPESTPEPAATEVAARAPAGATGAAAEEEAPATEPAPAGSAADDADEAEAPKSTSRSTNTFNREAARAALSQAATQAKNCRPAGGPSGPGRVEVRYEPSGKVAAVKLLTAKFENTTTGSCVSMVFRRAKVPEFTGTPAMTVNKSFEIP